MKSADQKLLSQDVNTRKALTGDYDDVVGVDTAVAVLAVAFGSWFGILVIPLTVFLLYV